MIRLSQKSKILAYMKSGKKITPAIAYEKFGCLRLSERVSWRELGVDYSIQKGWKKTRYSRVRTYYL